MESLEASLADEEEILRMQIEALKKQIEMDGIETNKLQQMQKSSDTKSLHCNDKLTTPKQLECQINLNQTVTKPSDNPNFNTFFSGTIHEQLASSHTNNKWKPLTIVDKVEEQPVISDYLKSLNTTPHLSNPKQLSSNQTKHVGKELKPLLPHSKNVSTILNKSKNEDVKIISHQNVEVIIIEDDADDNIATKTVPATLDDQISKIILTPITDDSDDSRKLKDFIPKSTNNDPYNDILWSKKSNSEKEKEHILVIKCLEETSLKTAKFRQELFSCGKILDKQIFNHHAYILYSKFEECVKAFEMFKEQKSKGQSITVEIFQGLEFESKFICDMCSNLHLFQRCSNMDDNKTQIKPLVDIKLKIKSPIGKDAKISHKSLLKCDESKKEPKKESQNSSQSSKFKHNSNEFHKRSRSRNKSKSISRKPIDRQKRDSKSRQKTQVDKNKSVKEEKMDNKKFDPKDKSQSISKQNTSKKADNDSKSTAKNPKVLKVLKTKVVNKSDDKQETNNVLSNSSSQIKDKKEKSTDCDSALIPMLCVHG